MMKKKGWTLERVRAETKSKQEAASSSSAQAVPPDDKTSSSSKQAKVEVAVAARKAQLRGKRGKLKKMKQKYADQDNEDLELHRIAVGHAKLADSEGGEGGEEEDMGLQNRLRTEETISKVCSGQIVVLLILLGTCTHVLVLIRLDRFDTRRHDVVARYLFHTSF